MAEDRRPDPSGPREPGAEGRREAGPGGEGGTGWGPRKWLLGLLPLVLLAGLVFLFLELDPTQLFRAGFPPVEELTIERVSFPEPGEMRIHVVNGGPEPVTVAQVLVDEAYWRHEVDGDRTVPRLGRATIRVPYPWVEGEPHEVELVTSTGLTFGHEVEVATTTPRPSARYFGIFALLGLYAGVIPVLIGLLWYPFLRDVGTRWLHFFLSLTVGLLLFLGIDALEEAFETAELVAGAFQGVALIGLGVLGAILALQALGAWRRNVASAVAAGTDAGGSGSGGSTGSAGADSPGIPDGARARLGIAWMIAVGIGLHNLGEGLAIGAAYALGEIALGSFLVIGFALHNTTEGLAIVAPVASDRPSLWHLAGMGAVAGVPTVAGAWLGGFSYSPIAATLFLALGAGAIFQVVWEVGKLVQRAWPQGLFEPLNAAGLALGLLLMYGTALLVVV